MMTAIELVRDRGTKEPLDAATGNAIVKRCLEEGVVILKVGTYDNVIRLLPPLVMSETEGRMVVERLAPLVRAFLERSSHATAAAR